MEELKKLLEMQQKEWAQFKSENDRRLAEIAATGKADPLTEAKIDKHSAAIGDLETKLRELETKANGLGAAPASADENAPARKAFDAFVRKGEVTPEFQKLISVGTNADGGFAVPLPIDQSILEVQLNNAPLRGLVSVVQAGNTNYRKLVSLGNATSGWSTETGTRNATTSPQFAAITPSFGELYAVAAATNHSLNDIMFNVEAWLVEEIGKAFGQAEDTAIYSGNGTGAPKGVSTYTIGASPTFGQIKQVLSGAAAAIAADTLFDVVAALKPAYRGNATWVMNAAVVSTVRKLKDTTNQYIWQPGLGGGVPPTLLGFPVQEDENFPAVGAANYPIWFGDWKAAYILAEIPGSWLIRDPFTTKGQTVFYVAKREGGALADSTALIAYKSNNA